MIGVVVDDDVIAIPEPVAHVIIIVGGHTKVEAPKLEPVPIPAVQAVDKTRANRAREMSVRPRLIKVIVAVVPPGIVAHPAIGSGVNVRCIWVARLLREITALVLRLRRLTPGRAATPAPCLGLLRILSLLPTGLSRTAISCPSGWSCSTRRTGRRSARRDVAPSDGRTTTLTATTRRLAAAALLTAATSASPLLISTATLLATAVSLGEHRNGTEKRDSEKSREFFHGSLL